MPSIRASAAFAFAVEARLSSSPLRPPLISFVTWMRSSRSQTALIFRRFQYSQAIRSESTGSAALGGSASRSTPSALPYSR